MTQADAGSRSASQGCAHPQSFDETHEVAIRVLNEEFTLSALLVTELVGVCARSAHAVPGSSLSVRVLREHGAAVLLIVDNGAGSDRVAALGDLARGIVSSYTG